MGNVLLARILEYFNGTLFLDDNYRFCVFFILHYQDFDSYTIEDIAGELQTTPESILNFLKYLGFDNYLSFIEIYQRHKQVRFEQIQERMKNIHVSSYVERIKVSNDNEAFLKKIEEVCTKIHDSKRVILVGALYPMSIAVEFQTDMISFGKTVLQYHTYDKDMIFPLSEAKFEGYIFPVPGDIHRYLTYCFGNYMSLPAQDKRNCHNVAKRLIW